MLTGFCAEVWKNIESSVLGFIGQVREERLEKIQRDRAEHRLRTLKTILQAMDPKLHTYHITESDVAMSVPEIRRLCEPHAEEFDEAVLQEVVQRVLPRHAGERIEIARKYFIDLVRQDIDLPDDVDPLSLVVAWRFTCKDCNDQGYFPQIVGHNCYQSRRQVQRDPSNIYTQYVRRVFDLQGMWSPDRFKTDARNVGIMVRLADLDPGSASVQDLDAAKVYFRCAQHPNGHSGERIIHTWRSAVSSSLLSLPLLPYAVMQH